MNWILDKNQVYRQQSNLEISYPAQGNQVCAEIESNSLWFQQRNEMILELILKHKLHGNFLDIGGGNGFQSMALLHSGYNGVVNLCEPGYEGCLAAKKRGVENVFNGFFQDFPFTENKIQVCGLFDVVEHIPDDELFMKELYNSLPEGGVVLINVPALNFLWSDVDEYAGHYKRYNKKDVTRICNCTGFKALDNGYFFSFYFLPLILLRVIPYRMGKRRNHEQIVKDETNNHGKTAGWMTSLLNLPHKFWLKMLRLGISAPYGTSMYMVLSK